MTLQSDSEEKISKAAGLVILSVAARLDDLYSCTEMW